MADTIQQTAEERIEEIDSEIAGLEREYRDTPLGDRTEEIRAEISDLKFERHKLEAGR